MNPFVAVLSAALVLALAAGCVEKPGKPPDAHAAERRRMVEEQIRARGISDERVFAAMTAVPRHLFVPAEYRGLAHADRPLPIGLGQTISQPYIVALMTESVRPKSADRALEIGTGSGYQAAVLGELVKEVYTIEIVPELAERARKTLKSLGYRNVRVRAGDGFKGWPEKAPFDVIVVTCAPPDIPQPLLDQLADGGRLVIPVGEDTPQALVLAERRGGEITRKTITGVLFVPMTGKGVEEMKNPPKNKK